MKWLTSHHLFTSFPHPIYIPYSPEVDYWIVTRCINWTRSQNFGYDFEPHSALLTLSTFPPCIYHNNTYHDFMLRRGQAYITCPRQHLNTKDVQFRRGSHTCSSQIKDQLRIRTRLGTDHTSLYGCSHSHCSLYLLQVGRWRKVVFHK